MLTDQELEWIVSQIAGTAEVLGYAITPTAAAIMAADLSTYPLSALEQALKRVRSEHTGKLTPKVIIERLEAMAGRLTPNEAWAIAMTARDERATVLWTDEMQEAWAVAAAVMAGGDKVGARMTFISAYERITSIARTKQQLPRVLVSFGSDRELRQLALTNAVERGHLSAPKALVLALDNGVSLPPAVFNAQVLAQAVEQRLISHEAASDAMAHGRLALAAPAINPVALLAGRVEPTKEAAPDVRARLAQLRDEVARRAGRFTRAQVQARAERMRLSQAKRQSAAAVAAYQSGGGA